MLGLDEIGALIAVIEQHVGRKKSLAQHVAAARDVIIEAAHLAPPGDLAVEIGPGAEFLAGISLIAARGAGEDEKAILKLLYVVHYYDMQIRKNMLSYTAGPAIEVTTDGHTVRLVSPTEISKALYMFRKGLGDELKQWINWYRIAKASPMQVTGDDTFEGPIESRPIYRRTYNLYN